MVRSATNQDTDRIVSLVTSILSEFHLQPDFETAEADLIDLEATYFETGGFFKIVENDRGNVLGTFGVYPIGRTCCKLRKMYAIPQMRGLGLGKHMLHRAIDEALTLGFEMMILETMTIMKDAIRLYTRMGFQLIKRQPESPRCELVFALNLSGAKPFGYGA